MTIRKVGGYGASLGANTFTGAQVAPSLALGGATIGTNALAVTGTVSVSGLLTGTSFLGDGLYTASTEITTRALGRIGFSANTSPSSGGDTAFSRISAGIIGVGTGAAGSIAGGLQAATLALGNTLTMTSSSSFFPQAVLANQVADANGPYLVLRKGRAAGTTTQNGDTLGNILFSGYASDNSIFNGPNITAVATGAASATGIATTTIFNTSTSSGSTEAFRYDTNGSVSVIGSVTSRRTTAIPAGGAAGVGVLFSSTSNYGTFFGSGAPTLSAAKGSLYLRSDGTGVADRMYVNTDGSTTWTAVSTVA